MMKKVLALILFIMTFFIYFGVSSQFTFEPKWFLDYYNPLASSIRAFRLDIVDPPTTYDLTKFNDKWYTPWGILPALFLIPIQVVLGRYVPIIYLSLFFASLNIVFVYLLLRRLRREFLPHFTPVGILLVLILFAFGTTHFYVGTLGGVWHVNQMVTSFFGILGIYCIFKKKREARDYVLSAVFLSATLLGRPTVAMLIFLPIFLYVYDYLSKRKRESLQPFLIFGIPFLFFTSLLILYNYLRFANPFEFGYNYMENEASSLEELRKENGIMSLQNIPQNFWYMVFEIPKVSFEDTFTLSFNLRGNSIFFLTPPFLAAFLASPIIKRRGRYRIEWYIFSMWITLLVTILPSLMFYNSGWIQFGFRYSLDIVLLLLILSLFGMKGKINLLYIIGVFFAVIMHILGIHALM